MPRRPYSRTGLNALKAKVKVRGLASIDRRTLAAQSLLSWKSDLISDLGGKDAVSAAQLALVEAATRTRLYVDHLDAWLMEQRSLVNGKRRSVLPVLRERQQLVDSLARLLGQLGLERKAPRVPTVAEWMAAQQAKASGSEALEDEDDTEDEATDADADEGAAQGNLDGDAGSVATDDDAESDS